MTRIWAFAVVLSFLALGGVRALHPALQMDEALFVGAARRILAGDVFLTDYWLDKPALGPFLIAGGILVAGANPLGFHLGGWIASMVMAVTMLGWIRNVLADRASPRLTAAVQLVALVVLLAPFMMMHHVSALLDPFLTMFLVLFGRTLYRAADDARAYRYFALASLCKLSTPMWAPMLALHWLPRAPLAGLKAFWRATRWIWLAGLVFMLTNPQKLAPLIWFSHLFGAGGGAGTAPKLPLFERLGAWVGTAGGVFGPGWLGAVIWGLAAAASVMVVRAAWRPRPSARKDGRAMRDLALLVVPFWLHAIGIWISGVSVFERYLYILTPQLLLVLAAGAAALPQLRLAPAFAAAFAAVFAVVALTPTRYEEYYARSLPPREWGRQLARVATELPRGAVVHHDDLLWFLHPFTPGTGVELACDEPRCHAWAQAGRAPFAEAYRIPAEGEMQRLTFAGCAAQRRTHTVDAAAMLDAKALRGALRLGGWAKDVQVVSGTSATDSAPVASSSASCSTAWASVPAAPLSLTAISPLGPVAIHGSLIAVHSERAARSEGAGRWILALRVEELRLAGLDANLVDLAPVLYKGYLVPLGPLPLPAATAPAPARTVDAIEWRDGGLVVTTVAWGAPADGANASASAAR